MVARRSESVKERPILFSGAMVRAILDGRKTVTRRIVKARNESALAAADVFAFDPDRGEWEMGETHQGVVASCGWLRCPYGAPGEHLWVRETWGARDARGFFAERIDEIDEDTDDEIVFRATCGHDMPSHGRWFPSIHMPRWASRITLEVFSVRVERLQEITEADARAEGVAEGLIPADDAGPVRVGYVLGDEDGRCLLHVTPRDAFAVGWDSINGKRAAWSTNPWVWRVEFRRVQP